MNFIFLHAEEKNCSNKIQFAITFSERETLVNRMSKGETLSKKLHRFLSIERLNNNELMF
jgi:hypothetical protein